MSENLYFQTSNKELENLKKIINIGNETINNIENSYKRGNSISKYLYDPINSEYILKLLGEFRLKNVIKIANNISNSKWRNTPLSIKMINEYFDDWIDIQNIILDILRKCQALLHIITSTLISSFTETDPSIILELRKNLKLETIKLYNLLYSKDNRNKKYLSSKYYKNSIIPSGLINKTDVKGNIQISSNSEQAMGLKLHILLDLMPELLINRKIEVLFTTQELTKKFLNFYLDKGNSESLNLKNNLKINFKHLLDNFLTFHNLDKNNYKLNMINITESLNKVIINFSSSFHLDKEKYIEIKDNETSNPIFPNNGSLTSAENEDIVIKDLIKDSLQISIDSQTIDIEDIVFTNWQFINDPNIYSLLSGEKEPDNFKTNWDIISGSDEIDIIKSIENFIFVLQGSEASIQNDNYNKSLAKMFNELISEQLYFTKYNKELHKICISDAEIQIHEAENKIKNIVEIFNESIEETRNKMIIKQQEILSFSTSIIKPFY